MIRYPTVVLDPRTGRRTTLEGDLVRQAEYAPTELDAALLAPDEAGRPQLRLVMTFDRLELVSTLAPAALIDPRNPHLGRLNLYASHVRGSAYLTGAFERADHRPGTMVELRREPDNPYDTDAVQLRTPGAGEHFGYVQRGKVPAVARLIDRGVDMAGITLHEGFVLLGPREVLGHLRPTPARPRRSFQESGSIGDYWRRLRTLLICGNGWSR